MAKICIIGGANIDICGKSNNPLRLHDSNPGKIETRFGGVGRNIAEVLCLLNQKVEFVTCFGNDEFGKALYEDCINKGMDCTKAKFSKEVKSSIYLAIMDENGELTLGMSDMRVLDEITQDDILQSIEDLSEEDILIVDSNLREELIEVALKNTKAKKVSDPVSASKCMRLKPYLKYIDIFKPNQYEAEMLSGIHIKDEESAKQCMDWFLQEGVKEILISLAEKGVLVGTKDKKVWYRHRQVNVSNVTGGGDSLLGMYLSKRLEHMDTFQAIYHAIIAAIQKIEYREIHAVENIDDLVDEMGINGVEL